MSIAAAATTEEPIWRDLAALNDVWLGSRARSFEVRRVTRRYSTTHVEPHTTRLVARRASDGRVVGWACLDHMYTSGRLSGGSRVNVVACVGCTRAHVSCWILPSC